MKQEQCCPKFNPGKWNNKKIHWKNKPFIVESIPTLFHVPFPPMIGKKITRMMNLASDSGGMIQKKDELLILFRDLSAFKSEIYLSVNKKVPGTKNVTLSGVFFSRVYEGSYGEIPKFIKEFNETLRKKREKIPSQTDSYLIHYAYCPKCEKKYEHKYITIFARID